MPISLALETAFVEALDELAPLLRVAEPRFLARWVHTNRNTQTIKYVRDRSLSVRLALATVQPRMATLTRVQTCRELYAADPVFGDAPRLAGYWGTFDTVFTGIAVRAARLRKQTVRFDHTKARQEARNAHDLLGASTFNYQCRARMFGVVLKPKAVTFPGGRSLHRLTIKERDQRQHAADPVTLSPMRYSHLGRYSTEARVRIEVAVERGADDAFFQSHNQAQMQSTEQLTRLAEAVTVVLGSNVTVGDVELLGGFTSGGRVVTEIPFVVELPLASKQAKQVSTVLSLAAPPSRDVILDRALRRLVLGHRRQNLEDRLVDYTIAWEALLLTQNGSAVTQELSYRFALHGAVLLAAIRRGTPARDFLPKMRSGYTARSQIVHGGSPDDLSKALKAGGFQDLNALCSFLQLGLRDTVYWLAKLQPKERPYMKEKGWDALLLD